MIISRNDEIGYHERRGLDRGHSAIEIDSRKERRRIRRRVGKLNARCIMLPRRCIEARNDYGMVAGPRNPRVIDRDLWYTAECPVMR